MILPIESVPNQCFNVVLNDKNCQIDLDCRLNKIFFTLRVEDELKVAGVLCHNKTNLVQFNYLGLSGNFYFEDKIGNEDPQFYGLGTRWLLNYV